MKSIITILTAMTISVAVFATNEQEVNSKIDHVTVYLNGAQIERKADFNLKKGTNEIIFSGLSPQIQGQSIQAKGKGDFIILDVKQHTKYPKPQSNPNELPDDIKKEIRLLQDSLIDMRFEVQEAKEKVSSLQLEKNMILKNKLTQGQGKSDSVAVLKEAMAFFRVKLDDIGKQLTKAQKHEYLLEQEQQRMQQRMNELKNYSAHIKKPQAKAIYQVIVTVSAEQATYGKMDLSYLVNGAGWQPVYDLRATDTDQPVKLTYKANVHQNTGEDWENVQLTLSTNDPYRNKTKPQLPVWYMNYLQQAVNISQESMRGSSRMPKMTKEQFDLNDEKDELMKDAISSADFTQVEQNIANFQFEVELPYTIKSDGQQRMVAVQQSELPAEFYHHLVPKLDREAFLVAKVTGWEDLNLLPGQANIFYDGMYIGKTTLNPNIMQDTLDLALGRDRSIVVERKKSDEEVKPKLIGGYEVKTVEYEINIKNYKSTKVNLVVEDQIPTSSNKDIRIELEEASGAKLDEDKGFLKWKLELASKEKKELKFAYSVTYDGEKLLSSN